MKARNPIVIHYVHDMVRAKETVSNYTRNLVLDKIGRNAEVETCEGAMHGWRALVVSAAI